MQPTWGSGRALGGVDRTEIELVAELAVYPTVTASSSSVSGHPVFTRLLCVQLKDNPCQPLLELGLF